MKTALTIAGSDCSGGAGIQADIKTMTANGVYAMSVITALTAQNTTGVRDVLDISPQFVEESLDMIFEDIFPDAVKIGMISSKELVKVIANKLTQYKAKHIVVDPVMVSTSGFQLSKDSSVSAVVEYLLPMAELVTPNIPEAEVLAEMKIKTKEDICLAAKKIHKAAGSSVLLKGGHSIQDANDLLYTNGECIWIQGERIDNPNTHGTGCTLSSAIAANLAKGYALEDSIRRAKAYISGALAAMLNLGHGSGPINHLFDLSSKFMN